jgi:hypothetical protein
MKLLFLPPTPMLTKKGKPRKRNQHRQRGRLFFADGREIPGVSRLTIESMPTSISVEPLSMRKALAATKYRVTLLTIELDSPEVLIIDQEPFEAGRKRKA